METQKIIDTYIKGQSLNYCSKNFNCSKETIKEILRANNIHIRTASEQTSISNTLRRQGTLNENYFSNIDTINKAWLLGFLTADGTIRKDTNEIKIGLSAKDKSILEIIKKEINTKNKIREYTTNNGFDVVELSWSSKQHKSDLAKFGIVNRKTYLPLHLPRLNKQYILAFILGYYDGDGCFSVSKDGYCRFRICAYRNELLNEIATFLNQEYNAKYSLCLSKHYNKPLWELTISTTYAIPILQDMYQLNSICLDRKYQKFLEYINHETVAS